MKRLIVCRTVCRTGTSRAALAALAATSALGVLASPGQAASALPAVSTGGAQAVSYGSAIVTGAVDPRGRDTSYYFQYGPTRLFGGQTTIADAGASMGTVHVSMPLSGLQPLTVYHYRLVAVSSAGAADGKERTLTTTKVPLSLQILSAPNPVVFGGTLVVQGTLSGTENAGRPVTLQANSFPFTVGFQNVGNAQLTSATGGFSFPVLGLGQTTQFRVVTSTNPPLISPMTQESVMVRMSAHIGPTGRRHRARFYGTVTPAENGMQVGVLKVVHGRYKLVAGTGLRHRNATSSSFSVNVPVTRGIYRVLVRVTSGAQISAYSGPLGIG